MTPLMKHLKEILQNEEAFKLANPIAKEIVRMCVRSEIQKRNVTIVE